MNDINVLIGDGVTLFDKKLFFSDKDGKFGDSVFVRFKDIDFPTLLSKLKFFKSNSEARKNGWNKPIPKGFSDVKIGKLKRRLTILNIK